MCNDGLESFDVAKILGSTASILPQAHPDSVVKPWENSVFRNLSAFSWPTGKTHLLAVVMPEGPRSPEMRLKRAQGQMEATEGTADVGVCSVGQAIVWSQVPTRGVGLGWEPQASSFLGQS